MKNVTRTFLFLCMICELCMSYKILVVFPMPGKSHAILGNSCVDLLLEAGHQVTYLTWGLGSLAPHQNLTTIDISLPLPAENRYSLKYSMSGEVDLNDVHEFSMIVSDMQRKIVKQEKIQKLLNDPKETFDVAVMEWLYGEYVVGIPAVFGCPYIWISSMEPHNLILNLIGQDTNPSYVSLIVFNNIPPFSFMDRVKSLWDQILLNIYREYYIQWIDDKEYQRTLAPLIAKRRGEVPSYNELRYNASLVLGNSHISVGKAIELPEAYKAVGGYHIKKNREPLPKDLKALMDNATNGVIYFSLGSTLKSKDIPDEILAEMLKIFGRLNQTILWKFESDLPNRAKNIHIISWAPQQSILAHPNCVLFISHGGQLSLLEALYFGVPLIGIPVFADQNINAKTMQRKGMAKAVTLSNNVAHELKEAIEEILSNPSYKEAAKHQSFIFHHRTVPPGTELVHWVEHVIQTNGAQHLRSIAFLVPWYQRFYVDAVIVVITIMTLLTVIVKWLSKNTMMTVKQANLKKFL